MSGFRSKLSALLVIVAVFTAAGAPVFAAQLHPACAAKQHDCGNTPSIAKCCCGDEGQTSNHGGPTEPRVQAKADSATTAVDLPAVFRPDLRPVAVREQAFPPRDGSLDRLALFGALLL